jgi:flagellar basal-body rod protein FlgC
MDLVSNFDIASSGLTAQNERLKIIAQNIANADSVATTAGGKPYQRKTISFKNVLDRKLGIEKVEVGKVGNDKAEFGRKFDPNNPAADADGYILTPNVNTMIEMTDMREARNSYQANLSVIEVTKSMIQRTLDLLRI